MRINFNIPAAVLILLAVFFLGKQCNNKVITVDTNNAHVQKSIDSVHDKIAILKPLERASDSVRIITKWKYRTLHDTIPCNIKLIYCDSVIYRDSISINYKDSIIINYDSLIPKYKKLAKIDSLKIDSLTHSRKKFWKGFKFGFCVGVSAGSVGASFVK